MTVEEFNYLIKQEAIEKDTGNYILQYKIKTEYEIQAAYPNDDQVIECNDDVVDITINHETKEVILK